MALELSIVIPAFNEARRLSSGFARLAPVIEELGTGRLEVVVVDDGSTDGTGPEASRILHHLPHATVARHEENRGKGAAVRTGLTLARGEKVSICDADMAIRPSHLIDLLSALTDSDVALGSRSTDGSIHYDSRLRTWAGGAFNALVRREVGTDVRDTQCGFKGYRLGAARLLAALGTVDRFAYDVENLLLIGRLGLSIRTVPVTWDDVPGSSIRLWGDSARMLSDIRGLRRAVYEVPVVRTEKHVGTDEVRAAAVRGRLGGLCIARSEQDTLIVLPRTGAIGGLEIVAAVGGELGVAAVEDLTGRSLEGV